MTPSSAPPGGRDRSRPATPAAVSPDPLAGLGRATLPAVAGTLSSKATFPHPLGGPPHTGLKWLPLETIRRETAPVWQAAPELDAARLRASLAAADPAAVLALADRLPLTLPCGEALTARVELLLHALLPAPCVLVAASEAALAFLCARRGPAQAAEVLGSGTPVLAWDGSGRQLLEHVDTHTRPPLGCLLLTGLGLVAWGANVDECTAQLAQTEHRLDAALSSRERLVPEAPPFGLIVAPLLPEAARRAWLLEHAPRLRGRLARRGPMLGRPLAAEPVLDALSRAGLRAVLARGTAGLRLADVAGAGVWIPAAAPAGAEPEAGFAAALDRLDAAEFPAAGLTLWIEGVGAMAFAPSARQLERRCADQLALLRIMRHAEALGGYLGCGLQEPAPGPDSDADPHSAPPLHGKVAIVTGGLGGIGWATACRLRAEGACVVAADRALAPAAELLARTPEATPEGHLLLEVDLAREADVQRLMEEVILHWGGADILVNNAGLSVGKSVFDTTAGDYDLLNTVMPRGSFLCSRAMAHLLRAQACGGDIVYIVSKNALFAGPNNIAYGTAKAAQLHQARLLAVELAELQVRVNVVNPDAVVRGSNIFSQGWGADRARAYGIQEQELGKFYASRSLLKQEMFPEDIAAAVAVLVGPELRKSTGLVINVDSGFAPAMVR